jgi:hypothetical protein
MSKFTHIGLEKRVNLCIVFFYLCQKLTNDGNSLCFMEEQGGESGLPRSSFGDGGFRSLHKG